jgi:hypothetical protein
MRDYTEIYGVLRLQTTQQEFEIEIVCKRKCIIYPITSSMTEKQIATVLSNSAPLKLKTHRELMDKLSLTLNDVRTFLFYKIREGVVIDRSLIDTVLPDSFCVRTVGEPNVTEDRAIMIPSDATVSIALELYPIRWHGSAIDRCRASDYSEAV